MKLPAHWPSGLSVRQWSRRTGFNPRSRHNKDFKMVLDSSLLIYYSNIRYVSTVKWSNPGKGVAPSPTPRCSSYWKGSLQVALDYSRQLYLLYIIINITYNQRISIMVRVFANGLGDWCSILGWLIQMVLHAFLHSAL